MNIESIKIAIDTGELQKAKDMLTQLENQGAKADKSVKGLGSSFLDLKGAIAGISLYQVSKQFIDTADSMNLLDSRLKLATKSIQEYTAQQAALTNIAKGSYTSINDTLTLYTKLAPALTQVGATTAQVNNVVSIFQKGLQLGGAKAQEASSAILQFSQAMGSGVLRGEEFNSVAEASPKLLNYLAQGLEVPQTALRKMAENGELTASKVANALLKVKSTVDNDFAQMPVTVGKAMTNLQTDLSLAVREIDKTTGATNLLATEIQSFSNNIDGYTKSILNFYSETKKYINENNQAISTGTDLVKVSIEAYLGYRAVVGIMEGLVTVVSTLKSGMMAFNPIIGAVALAGTALFNTWVEGKETADNLGKSVDELAKSMQKLDIQKRLIDVNQDLAEMDKRMQGYSDEYKLASGIASAYNMKYQEQQKLMGALDQIEGKTKSIKALWEKVNTDGLIKDAVTDYDKLSTEMQKLVDPIRQVREHYAKLKKDLFENGNATPQALANIAKEEAKAIESINKDATKAAEELKKKNEEIAKAYQDIVKEGMSDYDKKMYEISLKTAEFIKLTGDITTGLSQQEKAVAKLNEEENKKNTEKRNAEIDKQLKDSKDLLDIKEKQLGLIDDENVKNQELAKLYYTRRVEEIKALKEKEKTNDSLYQQQLDYEEQLLNKTVFRYSQTGQVIESVASGMKSSMMDFMDYTSAGFGNLKKLALDLGNMIYKAVTQQMIVNPLVGALQTAATSYFMPSTSVNMGSSAGANASALGIGGTDSTFMSSGSEIFKYASGGIFNSPSLSSYSNSVVSSPTMFAFASGGVPNMGIMGEKNGGSPEAIVPLTRTANGDLGVKSVNTNSNNGVVKVEVINQTTGEVQVTNTSTRQDTEGTVLSIVINGIQNNKMGLRTLMQGR